MTDKSPMAGVESTVLHIVHSFHVGGMENGLVNVLNNLEDGPFSHIVCAVSELGPMVKRVTASNVRFVALHNRGVDRLFFLKIRKVIRQYRPRCIHVRGWGPLFDTVLAAWITRPRPRLIFTYHGRSFRDFGPVPWQTRFLRMVLLRTVDRIATLNSSMANELQSEFRLEHGRVRILENGVDSRRFRPPDQRRLAREYLKKQTGLDEQVFVIGTVCRLSRIKNIEFLLKGLAMVKSSLGNFALLIIGDGPQKDYYWNMTQDKGLAENVVFMGERDDIPMLLQTLDLYVQVSHYEGFSNTILESMATGVPVLCARAGGNSCLVTHEETGLLYEPENIMEFNRYLVKLAQDGSLRQHLGAAARGTVEKRWTLKSMAEAYRKMYDEVVFEKG